jgi:hypothetical protein
VATAVFGPSILAGEAFLGVAFFAAAFFFVAFFGEAFFFLAADFFAALVGAATDADFFDLLTAAQRFRCASAIRFRASGLSTRLAAFFGLVA